MDTEIPYHPGMLLGRSVNMKTMQPGYMLIGEDINPTELKVSLTTSQFSFVTSLKDICDILSIPPEYALKVKAGVRDIKNELVEACLKDLGKADLFRIIFRVTFLEQKQYLSPDVVPVGSDLLDERVSSGERSHTTESLIAGATADSESSMHDGDSCLPGSVSGKSRRHHGTHWVKAIEIGNELVTVMTVSCKDLEMQDNLGMKFFECLQAYRGQLDRTKVEALTKLAAKLDKKLSQKDYTDVHLDIQYSSFTDLDKYPASITGMVKTIQSFMDQCVGWTEGSKHGVECEVEACVMRCKPGLEEEKTSMKDKVKHTFSNVMSAFRRGQPVEYHPPKQTCEVATDSKIDGNNDSFVVIEPSGTLFFYNLQITLQSFEEDNDIDDSSSSLALSQYPETTNTMFENVFKLLTNCDEAERLILEFLSSKRYLLETHFEEGNKVLKSIQNVHLLVLDTVADLDFVCIPTENTLKNMITTNPLTTVTDFIEDVTSKLPPGSDIDLLMIGKTGHGKSSTGNSILGRKQFVSSADGESVTSHSGVGWAEIDGRIIKVVDTPGVCDTNVDDDASSIDLGLKSVSEAIAMCPGGFHALLLIIHFGIRMTNEEKKAIGLLKCILGEDIVRSNCICVLTHGDNFETEMIESKTTFEEWCKTRSGYLKDLFKECGYRCVLFNNKARDPKVKKAQLIKLVSKVDSLKDSGTRYTNSLFEFAQRERQRIISEEKVSHVNEEMMRDVQLVIEQLDGVVKYTSEPTRYRDELSKLKKKVDNLNKKVTEMKNGQLRCLVDNISALAATIQTKMNGIADRPKLDSPDKSVGAIQKHPKPDSPDKSVGAIQKHPKPDSPEISEGAIQKHPKPDSPDKSVGAIQKHPKLDSPDKSVGAIQKHPKLDSPDKSVGAIQKHPNPDSPDKSVGAIQKQPKPDSPDKSVGAIQKHPKPDSPDKSVGAIQKHPKPDSPDKSVGAIQKHPKPDSPDKSAGAIQKHPKPDSPDKSVGAIQKHPKSDSPDKSVGAIQKHPKPDSPDKSAGAIQKHLKPDSPDKSAGAIQKYPKPDSPDKSVGAIQKHPKPYSPDKSVGAIQKQPKPDSPDKSVGAIQKHPKPDSPDKSVGAIQKHPKPDSPDKSVGAIQKHPKPDSPDKSVGAIQKHPKPDIPDKSVGAIQKHLKPDSPDKSAGAIQKYPKPDSPDKSVGAIQKHPKPDNPEKSVGAIPKKATPENGDNSSQSKNLVVFRNVIQKCHDDVIKPTQLWVTQAVSVKVQTKIEQEKKCFPGSSVVMLSNGKSATLEELHVGDKVLVRDNMGGLSFDTVYMFGHQELEVSSEFLALKTASQTVYVTAGHYVYCVKDGIELCVSAENVHVGDCLLVATGDGLVFQSVQAVTYERKRGLFAPFTNSGNIIIDGVLMSCYVDVLPATMCQTLLWPVRQLYSASPCMLSYINGPSSQHPVPRWAKAVMKLM